MHRQGLGVLALAAAIGCGSSSGSSGDTSSEDALTACAAGATVKGVDVSKYQGSIDWNAVKAGGTDFAFIRVSDGANSPDSYFAKNWDGAKGAGLVRGAYQFFRPAQDAAGQADLLVKAIGTLDDADITPVLDVEVTDGVSSLVLQQRMHTWLDAVESALGRKPLVYTASYMAGTLGSGFADYPLWVANWGVSCPKLPTPWSKWSFWQSSDKGTVSGISGAVDVDQFNGSLADLQAFVAASGGGVPDTDGGGPPPPPPPPGDGGGYFAPTWTQVYDQYLAAGTTGNCGGCHQAAMDTPHHAFVYLKNRGYIAGSIPGLVDPTQSPLSWLGGDMPPNGPTSYPQAEDDLNAWAMAGALDN